MITKQLDEFILDKDLPYWYVQLNNGEMVYQDEHRPGLIPNAWTRLCQYCHTNNLFVERVWIRFRSNVVELPPYKDAYYFKHGIMGGFCKDTRRRFPEINFFIFGILDNNVFKVTKWRIPEIIAFEEDERPIPTEEIIFKHKGGYV